MQLPSFSALAGMLIFSGLGAWAIRSGRKESNLVMMLLGFVLVLYSYFTPQTWQIWAIGVALTAGVFWSRNRF
jgi:ABC-type methionine transport system permease subunit